MPSYHNYHTYHTYIWEYPHSVFMSLCILTTLTILTYWNLLLSCLQGYRPKGQASFNDPSGQKEQFPSAYMDITSCQTPLVHASLDPNPPPTTSTQHPHIHLNNGTPSQPNRPDTPQSHAHVFFLASPCTSSDKCGSPAPRKNISLDRQ